MRFVSALLFGALVVTQIATAQMQEGRSLVAADLVADTDAVVAGRPFTVLLRMRQAEGWHTYWRYEGDSGLPTSIVWTLPEGFEAGPIQWPVPMRLVEPGDLQVYAFKNEVLLPVEIRPPQTLPVSQVTLRARADWLVCEKVCIPGSADLDLTLPVSTGETNPAHEALFAQARARLPFAQGLPYALSWNAEANAISLRVQGVPAGVKADFFPLPPQGAIAGHVRVSEENGERVVRVPFESGAPASGLGGLLVFQNGDEPVRAWQVSMPAAPVPSAAHPSVSGSLWKFLGYGFLGGLILNLMPCVLPVISLKVFGFIKQAGESRVRIFQMGLAFFAGILAWFLGLAGVIIGLKMVGREVTWAFQFQSPIFILVMSAIVFVFALNLFGVFEIVLPGKAGAELSGLGEREGLAGAFFQGVFATILATPCTAPFLGTALAFAFAQSSAVILLMFASIAVGMGSPYLLLAAKPGWLAYLPRPGLWMVRVKEFMGFLLIATLLWLLWVLGNQRGVEAVIGTGALLLVLAVVCWTKGALYDRGARLGAALGALLMLALGAWFVFPGLAAALKSSPPSAVQPADGKEGIPWQPFSESLLQASAGGDRIVLVDFTAQWCITCKFNEKTAINTPAVREWMAANRVLPIKADWTSSDPAITRALASFGRVGVPLYVIYPAGDASNPVVLPELITEQIVLGGLREAASRSAPQ